MRRRRGRGDEEDYEEEEEEGGIEEEKKVAGEERRQGEHGGNFNMIKSLRQILGAQLKTRRRETKKLIITTRIRRTIQVSTRHSIDYFVR